MPNMASSQSGLRKQNNHATRLNKAVASFKSWRRDDRGNVAMVFGLSIGAICIMVGGAVDMGRWLNARDQTQSSMDAAVLSGARTLQTGGTELAALTSARNTYKSNVKKRIKVWKDTVDFEITNNGMNVTVKGNVEIRTPFLQFLRIGKLPLLAESEAKPEATTAQDRFEGVNREVVLMLDVSGSMCQPCTKRDAMKTAAKDLIENMMRNNGKTEYTTRIGIVPFSGDVRPPSSWLSSITNPASGGTLPVNYYDNWGRLRTKTYYRTQCVGERAGVERYTNAAPGPGAYIMRTYSDQGSCVISSSAQVEPLTDNKNTVLSRINGLSTGGGTAGHIGTAWAYYLLSPEWNNVFPSANQPAAFGSEKLKKIAILMTDGEYNYVYDSKGLNTGLLGAGGSVNGKTSAQQAVEICKNMKDDNIEIYTVGFDLGGNQTAINTLAACATTPDNAYLAEDSASLQTVFRDIAVKLTDLHLSK